VEAELSQTADELIGNIKSSGEKRDFGTGAHRDSNTKVLKGRMDLIPGVALRRFAKFLTTIKTYHPAENVLESYNVAMDNLYLWMQGSRPEIDNGHHDVDRLSEVLISVQEIMHFDAGKGIWNPQPTPEKEGDIGTRFDRISPEFLRRVSIHYQKGGINYGDRNWELGMPVVVTWDSATRHMTNWLEDVLGDEEDHMAAVGWNICCTMHTIEMIRRGVLPETLWDTYQEGVNERYVPAMHRN
jgi:hypothetical protein